MRRPHWALYVLGLLWSSPLTALGLVLALIYLPKSVRWSDGCLEVVCVWIIGNPGAQTWGIVICCASKEDRDDPILRVHERVHVVQAFYGGIPVYALGWLAMWAWNMIAMEEADSPRYPDHLPLMYKGKPRPRWWRAYVLIYWERVAYKADHEYDLGTRPWAWGAAA